VIDLEGLANHRGSAFGGIDSQQAISKQSVLVQSLNPTTHMG
jgi:tRNA 2-selenouridine synthase SelU